MPYSLRAFFVIFVFHLGIASCICFFFFFPDYERLRSELSKILDRASNPPEAEPERTLDVDSLNSAPTKAMVSACWIDWSLKSVSLSWRSIYIHVIIDDRGTSIPSIIGAIGAVTKCAMWCNCANRMRLSRHPCRKSGGIKHVHVAPKKSTRLVAV